MLPRPSISAVLGALLIGCAGWCCCWAQTSPANTLYWQTSLEDAKRIAAETNRLVLVHFWSPSCAPCLQLEKNVFALPHVQQAIQARFVPVKLNADDYPTTVRQFGITRLPSDLIITPGAQIVGRMMSPPTPDAYLQQLAVAASGTGPVATPPASRYANAAPAVPAGNVPANTYGATGGWTPVAAPPAGVQPGPPPDSRYGSIAQSPTATAPVQNAQPTSARSAALPAYSDSRYGEFFQRFGGAPSVGAAGAPAAPTTPQSTISRPVAPGPVPQASLSPPVGSTGIGPATTQPNAAPPLALEGYSPVTLLEQRRWQVGDRRWGAIHRGRTYLFTGPDEQNRFMSDPDRYSPVLSGRDAVVALNNGQDVEGRREFGMQLAGRIYLFSSEASRAAFNQNPTRYAAEVLQAEHAASGTLR